jgi:RNA-directed DNA polymerase
MVDIEYRTLRALIRRRGHPYRNFTIKKRSGGLRLISIPCLRLLYIQKWIDKFILRNLDKSDYSFAYESGKKIRDCASQHLGCKWLIKIDLRDFFQSLSEIQVYHVFNNAGYSELVSLELARLCTRIYSKQYRKYRNKYWKSHKRYKFYRDKRIGNLPQGAPTSPRLSNAILFNFDKEIASISERYGLVYTRYADDIALSTQDNYFSRQTAMRIVKMIFSVLPRYGLRPNHQKVQIIPPRARKIVLGLLVDSEKIHLPKTFRNNLECHLYYYNKDPVAHAIHRKFKNTFGLRNHINGLLAYTQSIDPDYYGKLKNKNLLPILPI